ncbi:MAG: BlaI/MecI/CopY family transcriptional regulator [Planctomycetota bacterium]
MAASQDEPTISDAEWRVLSALWRLDDTAATAQAVAAEVRPAQGWAIATVKTLLGRLVEKEAVEASADPSDRRRFLYQAKLSPTQARRRAAKSFVDRIFAGDTAAGALHLVEQADLSKDQIDQLRDALASAERRAKGSSS